MWPTGLWADFKKFALKGSMVDMAIGVVIGGAFGKVVDALVKNVIMPALSYVSPGGGSGYRTWHLGRVEVGVFLGELVNFLIIASAMFLVVVKLLGTVRRIAAPSPPGGPTTKECPLCLSVIPFLARRCAHCTADLAEPT